MASKRKNVSIETKIQALQELTSGVKSKSQVAKEYGVPPSTLSTWIKNKDTILQTDTGAPRRKRVRTSKHSDVESALILWFKDKRSQNIPLSGPMLQQKAIDLAKSLGVDDFVGGSGWLDRFKKRFDISFRVLCGESECVTSDMTDHWSSVTLPHLLQEYAPEDIFNADESGLFYRLLPNKSLVSKGETCHGGKQSKERITILPCANMTGTEKLPLLVIGKSQKPRCFKGVKSLPVPYKANKKAWMTSPLFTEWIQQHDRRFAKQKRRVVFVIDNCPAHPHINGLKAIKLQFLPPNTTSKTQPMDQGIIANIKHHYRSTILQQLICAIDQESPQPSTFWRQCERFVKLGIM